MIRKLKSKAGLTLMEMMAALLVMVLLVMGMGTGMDAGMRVYEESKFETDSAALADILNTSISDLLRYAEDIKLSTATPDGIDFVFTNAEFGVLDGYFIMSENATIQLRNLKDEQETAIELVNLGAYPKLKIEDFKVSYVKPSDNNALIIFDTEKCEVVEVENQNTVKASRGGFFYIRYNIVSDINGEKAHPVKTVVRQMNIN